MNELEIDQKVRLKLSLSSFRMESLVCNIKWFENDRMALVFPDDKKHLIRSFPVGKELEALIYTDSGIYVFDSVVINSPLEYDFVIDTPKEKERIQRRDYIRAPLTLKLILNKEEKKIESTTINIGGGGIRFSINEELKPYEIWDFTLYLSNTIMIKGKGVIIYSFLINDSIISVIKFTDINETERNKIIKKCFEEEVKNLKVKKYV